MDDFSARLKPGAKRILMNTRWHEEDVAGRVLEQISQGHRAGAGHLDPGDRRGKRRAGPQARRISLGRARTATITAAFLRARQRETSPMMWSALYQQRPAPEEGDYFKAAWLRSYIDSAGQGHARDLRRHRDYAVTADGGDYTVHVVVGVDPDGRMYLLDLWRKQASSDEWVEAFCALVKEWKPREWAEEQGQIKAGVGPFIERMQRERQAFVYRRELSDARRQSGAGAIDPGPHGPAWTLRAAERVVVAELRSELLSFPAGKHDDQVDALGLIGQLLDTICRATSRSRPRRSSPTTATAHMILAVGAPMSGSFTRPRPAKARPLAPQSVRLCKRATRTTAAELRSPVAQESPWIRFRGGAALTLPDYAATLAPSKGPRISALMRWTVPDPTPCSLAALSMPVPAFSVARMRFSSSAGMRARPSCFPAALARLSPACMRWRIMPRSNSAKAPVT